jgi:ABC-type multidrug transport system ATPase subunit
METNESPKSNNTCGRVVSQGETRPAPVNIRFQDVSYYVKQDKKLGKSVDDFNFILYNRVKFLGKKYILKSLSGQFRSGELTAIMGPSGAGKSSFMNIMAGFK